VPPGPQDVLVAQVQRGWLTEDDVINTWPLTRLRRFLNKG
jgi:DNA polymerase (family 10)